MAGALVGGAFLSATLQVLFDRMASHEVLDFLRRRKLNDALLKNLKITLMAVNAVLNDAEEKQITNPAVKEWLDELKDAVYDAEDLLDEIAAEALRHELEGGSQTYINQVRGFFSIYLNPFEEGIASKIKTITENIDSIAKRKDLLGLQAGVGVSPILSSKTTSLVNQSAVYGRNGTKKKLIKLLLSDDASGSGICVIPIVGIGGVGKTTLAQLLYNAKEVNKYFDLKAWVCVSQEFDVFKITKTILESVDPQTRATDDLNSLQVKLSESLMEKKFLVVLDDIWNEKYDDWDNVRTPFRGGAKGSKIIVTTRSERVASIMRTVPTHFLGPLSPKSCWSLFTKHAFENGSANAHPNLEVIGKKIVKKCQGLPLAVKTLAGLLRSKLDAKEWNDILESKIWDLPDHRSNILPALRMSYHYLPTHLKRCFSYCSIFPKAYVFKKEKLVLLWIAEGIVQQTGNKQMMEEVGDEYFCELSSRSFFQQSRGNKSGFVMHDLINDLAQFVSGEFCYRLEDDKPKEVSEKVRHFSYSMAAYDSNDKFGPFYEIKCLRTFMPFHPPSRVTTFCLSNKVLHDLLPTLSFLRVLSLSHYGNITELPDSISNLKQLRYLDMSQTAIKMLPEVICTLYNLQTLILSDCQSLTELPANIGKLSKLRHLDVRGTNLTGMPIQMNGLKNLLTLTAFVVGEHDGLSVRELRDFRHLRGTLSILKLQNIINTIDALEANLKDKKYLDELLLEWGSDTEDSRNERDVFEMLQPSTNLKKLTIKYYGGTSFPNWLGACSFSNIAVMCISDCIYCLSLPSLGQLPSLEELSIVRINLVKRVGLEFYESGSSSIKPFQKLKTLAFEEMSEWEEWSSFGGEGGEFPSLQVLLIKECPKLRGDLPNQLLSLKKLVIFKCPQLTALIPMGMTSIHTLDLHGCREVVLRSVVDLSSLEVLHISEFPNITCLPSYGEIATSSAQVDQKSEKIPSILHGLTSLKILRIVGCTRLLSFPEKTLPSMLQLLTIHRCEALGSLPMGMIHNCTGLKILNISECPSLKSLPRGGLPTTLKYLSIGKCRKLKFLLPEARELMHNYYASLEFVTIHSCGSLKSFPLGFFPKLNHLRIRHCNNLKSLGCPKLLSLPNLTELLVCDCKNFRSLPRRMHTLLPSLQELHLFECPELELFPDGGLPSNLVSLHVGNCNKLMSHRMEWGLQRLASLKNVQFGAFCKELKSFPEERLLPSTLTSLEIWKFPKLEYLDENGFQQLTSLEKLLIFECPELQWLPEEGLPSSLTLLLIKKCSLLGQRCQREKEHWPKIAHIPQIVIDDELIS